MLSLEEFRNYLPKYLSPESEKDLFESLKQFPGNIDSRFYTNHPDTQNTILQGDGIKNLLLINLPDTKTQEGPAMVLSNTCDIHPENQRLFFPQIVYSPIIRLEKYCDMRRRVGHLPESISSHCETIKKQRNTSIFYLPQGEQLEEDSIIFFDKIISCDIEYMTSSKTDNLKLFTLSNYGFYLFLFKLSIHFTRIREGIDRSNMN